MSKNISDNLILTSPEFTRQKSYWLNRITDDIQENKWFLDSHKGNKSLADPSRIQITFPDRVSQIILKLGKGSPISIYIILLTAVKILLYRFCENEDITIISPVYEETVTKETMNRQVYIRTRLNADITFKELLFSVRQSTLDAYENQDYPLSRLMEMVFNVPEEPGNHRFSNVICTLSNIHPDRILTENGELTAFIFSLNDQGIEGFILRDSGNLKQELIKQIPGYFISLLNAGLTDMNQKISEIQFLPEPEKEHLIYSLNKTRSQYNRAPGITHLFEKQVKRCPQRIAAVSKEEQFSYEQLNTQANQLAVLLQQKGVTKDTIVALFLEKSYEMLIGILGILKSGGAYLPLDKDLPGERRNFILADSAVDIVVTRKSLANFLEHNQKIIPIDSTDIFTTRDAKCEPLNIQKNIAYVIYTSGSTGNPRGVLINQKNVIAYIHAFLSEFDLTMQDTVLQLMSLSFDTIVEEVFPILTRGGKIVIKPEHEVLDIELLSKDFFKYNITLISCTPLLLNEINKYKIPRSLKTVISGGDRLLTEHAHHLMEVADVYNTYGPTETTVCVTYHKCSDLSQSNIPIGKPIANYQVYILGPHQQPVPQDSPGEICVSGTGLARGYLNQPELTAGKFCKNPFGQGRLYKTGDIGKWNPNGHIEYIGRSDFQVNLRGYRIELGEIENQIRQHPDIKDVVVVLKKDQTQDQSLCAYFVSEIDIDVREIRDYISEKLPDYMIPSYLMRLDRLPVNSNGKINRRRLPDPVASAATLYVPPKNRIEEKMIPLWSKVLGVEPGSMGVRDNFFELGGHSIKATILMSMINKAFEVNVPLTEIFNSPSIEQLAEYINNQAEKRVFEEILPIEKKEYYPLSASQKGIFVQQQRDTSKIACNVPLVVPITSTIDKGRLENAFKKIIERHESYRTSFELVNKKPVQRVFDKDEVVLKINYFNLENNDLRNIDTEGLVQDKINDFIQPFNLAKPPLLRVGMIEIKKNFLVLMFDIHHIITDGITMDIIKNEFQQLYRGESLMPLKIQYKDYAVWQNTEKTRKQIVKQKEYWLNRYTNDIPVLKLPLDFERPPVKNYSGDCIHQLIPEGLTSDLKTLAEHTETTLYMVLLAGFFVLLSKYSHQEDIIIGSPVIGRQHCDLVEVAGLFVNMLSIRNQPGVHKDFRMFLNEVKSVVLDSVENQDYRYEELVAELGLQGDPSRNPLFDVVFSMQNLDSSQRDREVQQYQHQSPKESQLNNPLPPAVDFKVIRFDLLMNVSEGIDQIVINFIFAKSLFKRSTIEKCTQHYLSILEQIVHNDSLKLGEISISHDLVAAETYHTELDDDEFEL